MTPIKRHLLYIFRDTLLRLRITWPGNSLTLSVGYHVDRTDAKGKPKWDGSRCRINTTHGKDKVSASIINNAIENLEQRIENAFLVFEKADKAPTSQQLKAAINGERDLSEDFFTLYDKFLKEGMDNKYWSVGTLKKLKSRRNLLLQFDPSLTLVSLDNSKLNEYVRYQTENCISKAKDKETYTNTTIIKNVNLLKWFLRWAERNGYEVNPAYHNFSPSLKTPAKQVIFLDWDELMDVYNHDFSNNPTLDKVRDAFCFCCFTSLRYSDLANLTRDNISGDALHITTVKTADSLTIDLNKYSRAILDKYKDVEFEGNHPLPVISNQKMNDYLKDIARICGINSKVSVTSFVGGSRNTDTVEKWQLISTHCGRRTFICNALALGIPPNVVMKWTGHSDYKAMAPYIDIANGIRKSSMSAFDKM